MKILFLEDRPDRQRLFLPNKEKDTVILKNIEGLSFPDLDECKFCLNRINDSSYKFDENLKLVIVHRSSLSTEGLNYLYAEAKGNFKLIFFSGSIIQTTYSSDNPEQLLLNSTEFYSSDLIPFLEEYITDENITLLEITGIRWRLSYLLLLRKLLNLPQKSLNSELKNKITTCLKILKLEINIELLKDTNQEIEKILFKI